MKISDIFRQNTSEELKRGQDSQRTDQAARGVGDSASRQNAGEDTVSISALSRKLSQVSGILADDEVAGQDRVAELKQKVADGEYTVSAEDAAQSLLDYADDRVTTE